MKKRILFALLLCLVLCIFAFASCQKKDAVKTTAEEQTIAETTAATTAAPTAAGTTAGEQTTVPAATTAEPTQPAHVHTPESQMTVLLPPTCSTTGIQAYICLDCGATIDETVEEIPIDPVAHKVEKWIVTEEANLLHQTGSRHGECSICHRDIAEATEFVLSVYNPADLSNYDGDKSMLLLSKTVPEMLNGEHFYPTDENPEGLDAYFELSILWNETMLNCANQYFLFCVNCRGGRNSIFFFLIPRDDAPDAWCKYAGGFDWGHGTEVTYGPSGILNGQKADYPNLGEYGWHKIGVRFHQSAEIVEGAVVYSGYAMLYLDGAYVWQFDMNMPRMESYGNLLFTARIEDDKLVYADNPSGENFRMQLRGDGINDSDDPTYFVYGDARWAVIGPDWTPDVEPVTDPTPATFALSDTLTVPAAIYFREKTN